MDLILGTAGHIDHGKTALVQALTGINCDRLAEEKQRGITIELGFAWMDLPDGHRMGIVDVPGHERFIKNMVAGASGIDCVLLVIAADEGIMPQTWEHLEICSLLGVSSGVVALTKIDLVDAEWLKMVQEDVKNSLKDTFLRTAPIVPLSAHTGAGIPELRNEIIKQVTGARMPKNTDILRLPIDRVFSMKGFGTIVTGTLVSGSCAVGEKLAVFPCGKTARARNLQVHNEIVKTARQGQRCAINLQGLEVESISRGDVISHTDSLFPAPGWFILLECLPDSSHPIRQRMEVHFHHGARECMAKIILRDCEILEPGQSCLAEARFKTPIPAIYGDHFILRAYAPLRVIGGGTVINPLPPLLNKKDKCFVQKIALLQKLALNSKENGAHTAKISSEELTRIVLDLYPAPGVSFNQLKALTNLSTTELKTVLTNLEQNGDIFCWDLERKWWIGSSPLKACLEKCRLAAQEFHRRQPLKSFFSAKALFTGWGENLPEKFTEEALNLCIKKDILQVENTGVKLAGHQISHNKAETEMLGVLLQKIADGGVAPPFIREILEEQNWGLKNVQPLLAYLVETEKIVKIQDGIYYGTETLSKILGTINAWFASHPDLDIANLKTILGISRKYAIPILEYLDAIRMTYREDNKHKLRKKQETQDNLSIC